MAKDANPELFSFFSIKFTSTHTYHFEAPSKREMEDTIADGRLSASGRAKINADFIFLIYKGV